MYIIIIMNACINIKFIIGVLLCCILHCFVMFSAVWHVIMDWNLTENLFTQLLYDDNYNTKYMHALVD